MAQILVLFGLAGPRLSYAARFFFSKNLGYLPPQDRTPSFRCAPPNVPIDTEIGVHKNIAESDNLRLSYVRMPHLKIVRDPCRCFKGPRIAAGNKCCYVICGFDNV